jgi:hypothetical protein
MVPTSDLVMSDNTLTIACSILVFGDLAIRKRCDDVGRGEPIAD